MPILPICMAMSADAERVKYALDEGALPTAEDGTRRSLSGPAERVSAGKSRLRRRSGPGGRLSSSSGRVSGGVSSQPLFFLAMLSRRHLGGGHCGWSDVSAFGDFAMTGLVVRVARSLTVDSRAARVEAGGELKAADSTRRRGSDVRASAGASSCRVSGDCQRSWRVARSAMLVGEKESRLLRRDKLGAP